MEAQPVGGREGWKWLAQGTLSEQLAEKGIDGEAGHSWGRRKEEEHMWLFVFGRQQKGVCSLSEKSAEREN